MKILGIGVDLVKNQRIKILIKKNNFIKRTFSKKNITRTHICRKIYS